MIAWVQDIHGRVNLDDVDALGHAEELAMLADALPALEQAYRAYLLSGSAVLPECADDVRELLNS